MTAQHEPENTRTAPETPPGTRPETEHRAEREAARRASDSARHAPESLDADAVARLNGAILPLRRALVRLARTDVRLPELPDAQVELLRALPQGVVRPPGELASELGLSRPAVSNLLKSLEADGMITRHVAEANRRYVDVRASSRAIRRLARFDRASAKRLREAAGELTPGEREALVAALPALEHLRDAVRAASAAHRSEH